VRIRLASPEPEPEAPAGVLAGDDCVRAAHAWLGQRWNEVLAELVDVEETGEQIGRAYA
jgi:hypothetical protein